MKTEKFNIGGILAVVYGEASDSVYLFIHGKSGNKYEAGDFACNIQNTGYQVLGIDLPGHGESADSIDNFNPWSVLPGLENVLEYMSARWKNIALRANSIGAYFSMLAFENKPLKKCLFVSPIADMEKLICDMMLWAGVSEERLYDEKEIKTEFGETLSSVYYDYAKNYRITKLPAETQVLYAGHDNLTSRETITGFCDNFACGLQIYEDGEHWFHTPEQLDVLARWEKDNCGM